MKVKELLCNYKLCSTFAQVRKDVECGNLTINGVKIEDAEQEIDITELENLVIMIGKRIYRLK